jgi:hypothetical protein
VWSQLLCDLGDLILHDLTEGGYRYPLVMSKQIPPEGKDASVVSSLPLVRVRLTMPTTGQATLRATLSSPRFCLCLRLLTEVLHIVFYGPVAAALNGVDQRTYIEPEPTPPPAPPAAEEEITPSPPVEAVDPALFFKVCMRRLFMCRRGD